MDFALNETQREVQAMARRFAEKEIAPIVEEDEANSFFRKALFPKFGEAGLLGIVAPSEYGGAELGMMEYSLVLEELAYHSSAYATSFSVSLLPMRILLGRGSKELQAKYVPDLVTGAKVGAFCLTEPGSGSDASGLKSSAVDKGDHFLLNGTKQFITNGDAADTYIVMARTGGAGASGVSAFIVERTWKGVSGGRLEKKMGMRASATQEMIFENVKVPKENLVGKLGEGMAVAYSGLDGGRIAIASIANGISRAAMDKAVAYAKTREQFGEKITRFQGVSFLLADMAVEYEASVLLTRQAAWMTDQGECASKHPSMAKLKATESCMKITTDAVQVLGGYGYMEDYVVERYMREAKMLEIVEGTSQIQRMIISRGL